jgi:hypothetical protein
MVTINKDNFTIEVYTGGCTADQWQETVTDMIDLLIDVNPEIRGEHTYYHALHLLKAMMPSQEQAAKMFNHKK